MGHGMSGMRPGPGFSAEPARRHTDPMSNVPQKRLLQTAIPGPRSAELQKRKTAAVSAGVSTGLPVYVERAGGGILVDVDDNHLIDFGSGIAVTTVGNAAERVVANVQGQVAELTAAGHDLLRNFLAPLAARA